MNISTLLLLLLSFTTLYSTRAEQVVLLDTRTATTELNWKTWSNQDERDGWVEETIYSDEQKVNHRVFSICDVEHVDMENWLLVPHIHASDETARIQIEIGYSIAICKELQKKLTHRLASCKETMKVYATTLDVNDQLSQNWFNETKWDYFETLVTKSESDEKHIAIVSYAVRPPLASAKVHFAIKNTGACSYIHYVKVYYNVCPETTDAFVYLPKTLPADDETSFVTVVGQCVENASPSLDANSSANNLSLRTHVLAQPPTSICMANGVWRVVGTSHCECNAGYIPSLKTNLCTACGIGTYKAVRGSGECIQCPEHSTSHRAGSPSCGCDAGYIRMPNESIAYPCKRKRSDFGPFEVEERGVGGQARIFQSGGSVSAPSSAENNGASSSAGDWLRGIISAQEFWPWLVVCFVSTMVLCSILLVITRNSTFNRKQMSDMDTLDNYKQDIISPDYSRSLNGQLMVLPGIMKKKLNAPLISTYSTAQRNNLTLKSGGAYGEQHHMINNNSFRPYVDPTTYEDPKMALSEFANEVDADCITLTRVIGHGEFGEVCSGRLVAKDAYGQSCEHVVAVKTLLEGSSTKAKSDFLTEASIMGQFEHENVIRLLGVVSKTQRVMILTEYMLNGSLDKFLQANDNKIEMHQLVRMIHGIACGMKYLTEKGYVHRDLAARNVLVDDRLTCKIADFGLSRGLTNNFGEQEYTTKNTGKIPIRWTAPEAINHQKYTAASDVWSFGVVMWEVLSFGDRPYWDWANHKVVDEVMNGYRLPRPKDTPIELYEIMLNCWAFKRHDRPTFAHLVVMLDAYYRDNFYFTDPMNSPNRFITYGGAMA